MSEPYVGEIRMFGGNFAPAGWALCNGEMMGISENDVLFTLIGTTYGGDGEETFGLPNLQSRMPIHSGNGFVLGQMAGVESVTLTANQIPVHNHVPLAAASGTSNSPNNTQWAIWPGAQYHNDPNSLQPMYASTVGTTGGSQPHENMPPYLTINFIISLFGIFPQQN